MTVSDSRPDVAAASPGVWICPTHVTKGVYWESSDWGAVITRP